MDRRLLMIARDYLAGEMPLDRLQGVIMDLTWDAAPGEVEADTVKLAKRLDLLIAEHTGGYMSEEKLKAKILEAIDHDPTYVLSAGEHALQARMGPQWRSSAQTQRQKVAFG